MESAGIDQRWRSSQSARLTPCANEHLALEFGIEFEGEAVVVAFSNFGSKRVKINLRYRCIASHKSKLVTFAMVLAVGISGCGPGVGLEKIVPVKGTNEPGDGAAPGKHRVSVNFIAEKMEGEPGRETFVKLTPKVKLPAKYQNPDTSGVEIEIPDSGSDSLNIDLK